MVLLAPLFHGIWLFKQCFVIPIHQTQQQHEHASPGKGRTRTGGERGCQLTHNTPVLGAGVVEARRAETPVLNTLRVGQRAVAALSAQLVEPG